MIDAATDDAIAELAPLIGTRQACQVLGRPRSTHYRRRTRPHGPPSPAKSRTGQAQPRALSGDERQAVLAVLHDERFVDLAPAAVYATLLDEGVYLASQRTMYRLLAERGETGDRRRHATHAATVKPELVASAPNRVWSWDITKLAGPVKWTWYQLYVLIDIYSRYAPGWLLADREDAKLAEQLMADTCARHSISAGQLTIHADRGSSMTSKPVALLLADLGVTKSHSRPHTSNDNPYSESHFRTLKYRPEFPQRFDSIEHARSFCDGFFGWYNHHHRHSGIGLMTPADVHYGRAAAVTAGRAQVLDAAYAAHPERFVRQPPQPPRLSAAAWINKPAGDDPPSPGTTTP